MANLPTTDRLLLGPGPSPISSRVLAALSSPQRSHLDPELLDLLDDVRGMLGQVFRGPSHHLTVALSGTGTAAMDAAASILPSGDNAAPGIPVGNLKCVVRFRVI